MTGNDRARPSWCVRIVSASLGMGTRSGMDPADPTYTNPVVLRNQPRGWSSGVMTRWPSAQSSV